MRNADTDTETFAWEPIGALVLGLIREVGASRERRPAVARPPAEVTDREKIEDLSLVRSPTPEAPGLRSQAG